MISATVSIMSGSLDGGLSTIGLPDAIAGDDLVRREVEREVERARSPAIGPDREAAGDADPARELPA